MQKITFWAVLAYLVSTTSCSTFYQVKPNISKSETSLECKELVPLIEENWKKHKKLDYYKAEGDFLTIVQRDYRKCITSLTKEELIKFFGQPVGDDSDFAYYFLNETCVQPMRENCQAFIFYFNADNEKVTEYLVHPFGVLEENK